MAKLVSLDTAPTTNIAIYRPEDDEDDGKCYGSVAVPVRDHLNAATVTSLIHTNWSFSPAGKYVGRFIIQGNILTLQRNEAVQRMKGDWLLFIDDDMVWNSDQVARLVAVREELDADILGALCYRRASPHQPTMFMREGPTEGAYNYLEEWDSDIVEVDATGMAFAIIHKRVFERIAGSPFPPFEERRTSKPPNFFRWSGELGEDLQFCQDAKAAGCRIFVDTRNEVGHIGEIEIRKRQFLIEHIDRPEDLMDARRAINDRMGLPTMTKESILRRLGWND